METKSKDSSMKIILVVIAIGIWVIALQNVGIIPTNQNVRVNGGYVRIGGVVDANVSGTVSVDNTVSVSVDEVLGEDGKKYYYKN